MSRRFRIWLLKAGLVLAGVAGISMAAASEPVQSEGDTPTAVAGAAAAPAFLAAIPTASAGAGESAAAPRAPIGAAASTAALPPRPAAAQPSPVPGRAPSASADTAQAIRIVIGLTLLAVLPALLVCLTSFLRSIIVLSMLRQAIGLPETPPNMVLIGLSLFLTMFTMAPVFQNINDGALQPFLNGRLSMEAAYAKGVPPLREFMVRQTREQDLLLLVELSKAKAPQSIEEVSNVQLIPAYMLSELRAAFQIGFVIFLPFLLIDLIVSSVLMALGMMMMPPTTVSLPLKILMFILVDGWSVVLKALVGSFR